MGKGMSGGADQDPVRLYLDGIGRYPLLTKEDEIGLSQLIEAGRSAAAELAGPGPLPPERARQLRRARRDGEAATGEFIKANLRLVVSIAKKYHSSELPLLDLIQEGNLGLMHAVEKFDWRRGFKFSTYATWWIRQAIGRGIDNTSRTVRLPVHAGDQVRRVLRAKAQLEGQTGRSPSTAQLARHLQMREDGRRIPPALRGGARQPGHAGRRGGRDRAGGHRVGSRGSDSVRCGRRGCWAMRLTGCSPGSATGSARS